MDSLFHLFIETQKNGFFALEDRSKCFEWSFWQKQMQRLRKWEKSRMTVLLLLSKRQLFMHHLQAVGFLGSLISNNTTVTLGKTVVWDFDMIKITATSKAQ